MNKIREIVKREKMKKEEWTRKKKQAGAEDINQWTMAK